MVIIVDKVQFRRRVWLEILVFLALVSLAALVLKPLEAYLGKLMGLARDALISEAESVLNRNIRYGSANPSIMGSLEINDVSVFREGEAPALKLKRFTLGYSLGALIAGKRAGAIRFMRLEGLEFVYDLGRDQDLAGLFTRSSGPFQLPGDCLFQVREGSLLIKKGARSLHISGLSFDGAVRNGRVVLDGSWHTEASLAGFAGGLNSIVVDGVLNGDFTGDFSNGSLVLGVSALRGDTFELGNLSFFLSVKDNLAEFTNTAGTFGLRLAYDLDRGVFSGEFKPEENGFALREILSLTGAWEPYNPWLDTALSGILSFSSDPEEGVRYTFDLEGKGGLAAFDLAGSGSAERLILDRCNLEFRAGKLSYSGDLLFRPLLPEGTLVFSGLGFSGEQTLNGELHLTREGRSLDIFGENFKAGRTLLSAVSGGIRWDPSASSDSLFGLGGFSCRLELLRFRNIESYENVEMSSLSLNASYENDPAGNGPGRLEGSLALESFLLEDLLDMAEPFFGTALPFPIREAAGSVIVTTELFVSTDFVHVSYNAPNCVAVYDGLWDAFVVSSLSGTDRRFEISNGRVSWKDGSAELRILADFANPDDISFLVEANYRNFAYYFEGAFFDRRTITVRGSYGMSLYLSGDEESGYSGYVYVASLPLPFRGRTGYLHVDTSVQYVSSSFWNVGINRFQFRENENPSLQYTSLLFSGRADQNGLEIERLNYADRLGELSGSVHAEWEKDFSSASALLSLEGGTERCVLEMSWNSVFDQGRAAFSARMHGVKLERFTGTGKNIRLSGTVSGVWEGSDSYSISLNLESSESFGENPDSFFVSGSINPQRIDLSSNFRFGGLGARGLAVSLDRSLSRIQVSGLLEGVVNNQPVGLYAALDADFAPVNNWFALPSALRSFSGKLKVESAHIGSLKLEEPCLFDFSRTPGENGSDIRLSGGPGDMLKFELLGDGSLYADLAYPSPLRGNIIGTLKDFYIDVFAAGVYIDLPLIWAMLPIATPVVFTGGFITGETRIAGSLSDPEFFGSAWGSSVRLLVPGYISAEIGPGSGTITLDGSEISFGPVKARCGNGQGEITASIRFNRWVPSFDIGIRVPEDRQIPFDFDIAGVKAKGEASGFIGFNMENSELLVITGDVHTENTEITLNAEEFEVIREGGRENGQLDIISNITITAGKRVEFIWPSEDFPVLRAYGASGSGIRVITDTRIPLFALDGEIALQGGEIYYFQRSFFVREGKVFFNRDSSVDPYISMRAEIRDRVDEGPVVISLIVDYSPLSSLVPRFESIPALSQLEIYSLLGQTPPDGQQSEAMVRVMVDALQQFTVVRRVERGIRDALGLDMFTIRTQLLQNALLQMLGTGGGGVAGSSGLAPARDRDAIGNYLDNTSVFMGKYIGSDLFTQIRLSLRYDQYREEFGGLWLEPDIGFDLRTPLANIRWSISPKRPENLLTSDVISELVSDQSLSLIWRWMF
jgi:hypothetical protein